jgi:circadian clock protein KaiB
VAKSKCREDKSPGGKWILKLYVAGETPRSLQTIENLKRICHEHLAGAYRVDVVDLQKRPHLAKADQIVALPTLIIKHPEPVRRILGNLANTERVLAGLHLPSRASIGAA